MAEKKVAFDFHNCPECGSGMINLDDDSPGQENYSCGDCHAEWIQNYVYTDAYLIKEGDEPHEPEVDPAGDPEP